jgi:hypothetical protein
LPELTPEMQDRICDELAAGRSLRSICDDPAFPSRRTVYDHKNKNEAFAAKLAEAHLDQADFYFDQIIEIADSVDDPQKARVQIDARKWVAGKLRPNRYGDKVGVEHNVGETLEAMILASMAPKEPE